MDEERLELIAARMREIGERTDLLPIYERLRIAVRQREMAAEPVLRLVRVQERRRTWDDRRTW